MYKFVHCGIYKNISFGSQECDRFRQPARYTVLQMFLFACSLEHEQSQAGIIASQVI